MRGPASPVFTARISEFMLQETQPPEVTALSGLELRLFIPDAHETVEMLKPREYILQLDNTNVYNHFFIRGIENDTDELHNVCMLLMKVRDTFFNGLMGFINLKADS